MRFTLIEHDTKTGEKSILGIKDIEWRYVLSHEKLSLNIAFEGLKNKAGGSLGVLKLEVGILKNDQSDNAIMDGIGKPKTKMVLVDEQVLQT